MTAPFFISATFLFAASAMADPQRSVTTMADGALTRAWPDRRHAIEFEHGRFSPDGTLFGFSISQVMSGDPEQVWLYDLRTRQLKAISEAPLKDAVGFNVSDIAWGKENTLYVDEQRIEWKNQSQNREIKLVASLAGTRELKNFPHEVTATFAAQALPEAKAEFAGDRLEQNRQFIVRADNKGHGVFTLTMIRKRDRKKVLIASGGGELSHFLFDAQRSVARYLGENGIVTVELKTGKTRILPMASRQVDATLLDASRDASLLAYTRRGPCQSDRPAEPLKRLVTEVCFARLQP